MQDGSAKDHRADRTSGQQPSARRATPTGLLRVLWQVLGVGLLLPWPALSTAGLFGRYLLGKREPSPGAMFVGLLEFLSLVAIVAGAVGTALVVMGLIVSHWHPLVGSAVMAAPSLVLWYVGSANAPSAVWLLLPLVVLAHLSLAATITTREP